MFDASSKSCRTSVNKIWRPEEREVLDCLTWSAIGLKTVISVSIIVVFAWSEKKRVLASSFPSACLSVCPLVSARLTLDGFL